MPPICSPMVRPGRPAEVAPVISKQLSDVIMRCVLLQMSYMVLTEEIKMKEKKRQ